MQQYLNYLIPVILIGFLLYKKVKRSIGFQKYSPIRLILRIVLFSLVALLILAVSAQSLNSLVSIVIGIVVGLTLVYYSIKHTVFETREDGLYYRTHQWIEAGLLFMFFARFFYRLYVMYSLGGLKQQNPETDLQALRDPLTGIVFFVLCSYYIGYFSYVIRQSRQRVTSQEVNQ